MPYVSEKQRRFFHTATAREHGITPAMVKEWDAESAKAEKRGAASVSIQTPRVTSPKPSAKPLSPKPEAPRTTFGQAEVVNQFGEQARADAQGSSTHRFNAGQKATMPVVAGTTGPGE